MTPQRPAILFAYAFTTFMFVAGEPFQLVANGGHVDTQVRIKDARSGDVVYLAAVGSPTTEVTVTGLTLVPGDAYIVSIRYENPSGFSKWAKRFVLQVPLPSAGSSNAAATIAREPVSAGATPHPPEFADPVTRERPPRIDAVTDSGDVIRKPLMTSEFRSTRMRWRLDAADYAEQLAFIRGCLDQAEAFTHDGRLWFPLPKSLRHANADTGFFTIELEAMEVVADSGKGTFTIGKSYIGSPDEIG